MASEYEIKESYKSKINKEKLQYARDSINIRKNFLLSKFQKTQMLKNLTDKLNSSIKSLEKEMIDRLINTPINSNDSIKTLNTIKKALLIGINYENTYSQLNGCINDVSMMETYLKSKGFSDITLLTDNTEIKPTKANILSSINNFFSSSKENDFLYFHYSGHGSYINDKDGDEDDGLDESIVSKDMILITDDELISLIKQKMNKKSTLFAVFDSCHSGTMLDLKYTLSDNDNMSINDNMAIINNPKYKDTLSNIIMLSGCKDSQTSQETYISNKIYGMLTWALKETFTKNQNLTWKSLYTSVKKLLQDKKVPQIPQLSMGSLIDIGDTIHFLT